MEEKEIPGSTIGWHEILLSFSFEIVKADYRKAFLNFLNGAISTNQYPLIRKLLRIHRINIEQDEFFNPIKSYLLNKEEDLKYAIHHADIFKSPTPFSNELHHSDWLLFLNELPESLNEKVDELAKLTICFAVAIRFRNNGYALQILNDFKLLKLNPERITQIKESISTIIVAQSEIKTEEEIEENNTRKGCLILIIAFILVGYLLYSIIF